MACKICGATSKTRFETTVLGKYRVAFQQCVACRFLQSETLYWLEEAYEEAMTSTDTGVVSRNIALSRMTAVVHYMLFGKETKSLDYAGGHGLLTRMMRDIGFDCYWHDPHAKNIFARGFEYGDAVGRIGLVTCYEAFEHFAEPLTEVERMLSISRNILFSTELLPDPAPAPDDWWYYGFNHGQHISFYSRDTLSRIANRHGLRYFTDGRALHMYSDLKIPATAFRILQMMNSAGLWAFVRSRMKSRTQSDMRALLAGREQS